MKQYYEKLSNRILEVLNCPLIDRCTQLENLFDRCNIRELQEVFPAIVHSIFGIGTGNLGWGLRTVTEDNGPEINDTLLDFFSPMGPMLQLCYRLLNDVCKFDVALNQIPRRLYEMLQSGKYSMFYTDLINVDTFHRQVSSLSLNAFDFYMLHFVVHATFPLHKWYPAALQIHNEREKTVYYFLVDEYLDMFLPSSPDDVVTPTNICMSVKVPQPVSIQPLQSPKRSPKYLKIPNTSLYNTGNNASESAQLNCSVDSQPRAYAWRTESILHFFIDIWLRYDADETRDLPSSEFMRVVRLLVKHSHAFANSSHLDQTSMAGLRKMAQPMMRNRFYPFIKSIIGRWPLDSSLSVVLELWLSYIQPWRYTFEWNNNKNLIDQGNNIKEELSINNRFEMFIIENIIIYTQVFVHILPRFARLDFSSLCNAVMLNRFVKVFSQSGLASILYQAEQSFGGNNVNMNSTKNYTIDFSNSHNVSGGSSEWDNLYHEEVYVPMFGSEFRKDVEQFIRFIYMSRTYVTQEIKALEDGYIKRQNSVNFLQYVRKCFNNFFEDYSLEEKKFQDIIKIPDLLGVAAHSLCRMFNINPSNIMENGKMESPPQSNAQLNVSENLDISHLTPAHMMENLSNMKIAIDPVLLPIQSYECAFLVRLFHWICTHINEQYGNQIQNAWNDTGIIGKISHQILYGPMTVQWFDKPCGVNTLCEEQLPARLCLRNLASFKYLFVCFLSLVSGYFLWGSPFLGLIMLCLVSLIYIFIIALIS